MLNLRKQVHKRDEKSTEALVIANMSQLDHFESEQLEVPLEIMPPLKNTLPGNSFLATFLFTSSFSNPFTQWKQYSHDFRSHYFLIYYQNADELFICR